LKIQADFVTSMAATSADIPREAIPAVALVGRSNVGKSSLINALVRQRLARTSAAPGKTRLANIYRVARGGSAPLHIIDLPGYGFARAGSGGFEQVARLVLETNPAVVFLVDARHPGLANDRDAWNWVQATADCHAVVACKIDKLARGERTRAQKELDSAFNHPVLPVSAVTGEGLDELWKLIDNLLTTNRQHLR
jgi:GTP-binding protein